MSVYPDPVSVNEDAGAGVDSIVVVGTSARSRVHRKEGWSSLTLPKHLFKFCSTCCRTIF